MIKEIYDKNTEWFRITYNNLVKKAKLRGLDKKKLNYYTEKHHIIPKCMGGKNERSNYVLFTFREHLIAHELLARIYDNETCLKHTLYFMYYGNKKYKVRMTSRQLEELRIASIKFLSKKFKGREIKKEWVKKANETKRSKGGLSEYTKKRQALGRVGMTFTEERKKKISKSMKGKKPTKESLEKRKETTGIKIQSPSGIVYRSKQECSRLLGISLRKINSLLKDINSGYKIISIKGSARKVVDPEGVMYQSIRKCAEKFKRDPKCIKNWIENYPEKGFKYYSTNKEG